MNTIIRAGGSSIVVYDLTTNSVVHELTDYALFMFDKCRLDQTTVSTAVNCLVRFCNHLVRIAPRGARSLMDVIVGVTDKSLEGFRDADLKAVRSNSRSRNNEHTAKATVNARLASVYQWIWWLKTSGHLPANVAGPSGCAVTVGEGRRAANRRTTPFRVALDMPLLYSDAARRGRHKTGFVATRDTTDGAVEALMSRPSSEYRNLRDALIVDLATEVGLRVGSVVSLLDSDFDRAAIERTIEATMLVTPRKQKFSYQNSFDVPIWLALRVCALIELRNEYVESKGKKAAVTEGAIFISELTCKPLTSRAVSQLVSRVLRSLGAPKGAALHAFRGLFCTEEIETEIDERSRLGLDTSTASVSAAVALKMGHRDPLSLFSYVSRSMSLRAARERAARERAARGAQTAPKGMDRAKER
ncbi:tyrosine-type recombinase/integrase [Acidovorax temperans]|uniref:tyrosine-type recombinase/integrase n=1 Tax=Acidovorax temperans TaxID=80878 RepID=UPI0030D54752